MTARVVARMGKERDMLQFHQYQYSEFAGVLGDSVRDQLTWIQARFAGRPPSGNCHRAVAHSVYTRALLRAEWWSGNSSTRP
jgi:hypothetical protein